MKPENRETIFGSDIETATQRELAASENTHSGAGEFSKLASHAGLNMRAGGGSVSGALISARLCWSLPEAAEPEPVLLLLRPPPPLSCRTPWSPFTWS